MKIVMRTSFAFLTVLLSFNTMASGFVKKFLGPSGNIEEINLQSEAISWAESNIQGMALLSEEKKTGIYYIVSIFLDRINTLALKRSLYDELYERMRPGDVSYSPYFVKEGIKIAILGPDQHVTDFPEYSHWKGKTVEDVFGYKGDHRLMDFIEGEATRNTCLLKEHRVGRYPKGSSNTFYHEFGHFLHMSTFSIDEFMTLEKLYLHARSNDMFLDDYAAQSVHEYFAQGLEAYVSETKTKFDRAHKYTKSDREDLKRIDHDLFEFIERLLELH